jgi:hypothetical protein
MKLFNSALSQIPNAKKEPLYTLEEIADKLGVEHKVLMSRIIASNRVCPSPKPVLISRSGRQMAKNLYALSEYKVWWKSRQDFIKGESK